MNKLDMLYMELGKAYYEGGFEDPLPQLLPLFDQITLLKKQQKPVCPKCGADLYQNARFCAKCGCPIQ